MSVISTEYYILIQYVKQPIGELKLKTIKTRYNNLEELFRDGLFTGIVDHNDIIWLYEIIEYDFINDKYISKLYSRNRLD